MYSPNNASVYLKSFAGFMAGIASADVTATSPHDFAAYAQQADAYAQEVDTVFGTSAPTGLELDELLTASESVWESRSSLSAPDSITPAAYHTIAESVVARARQGNAQVVSEGIDPNAGSPKGGTTSLFIFRPGGVAGGNVYTDEASLAAAIGPTTGSTLFFDLSLTPEYTFTTVGALNLGLLTNWITGGQGITETALVFANGTQITNPPASISSAGIIESLIEVSQSVPVISYTAPGGNQIIIENIDEIFVSGTANFYQSTESEIFIFLRGDTSILGAGAGGFVFAPAGEVGLLVVLEDEATVSVNSVPESVALRVVSPGASLDASFYPRTSIIGLFVDQTGTGTSTLPAGNSTNSVLSSGGALYVSNGTEWVPSSSAVRIVSPNGFPTFVDNVPGTAGEAIAVFDITPSASGIVRLDFQIRPQCNQLDVLSLLVYLVPDITAVNGGTLLAEGLTAVQSGAPGSLNTTPAYGTGAIQQVEVENLFVSAGTNTCSLKISCALTLTPGTRYGVVVVGASNKTTTSWLAGDGSASLIEEP